MPPSRRYLRTHTQNIGDDTFDSNISMLKKKYVTHYKFISSIIIRILSILNIIMNTLNYKCILGPRWYGSHNLVPSGSEQHEVLLFGSI